MAEPNFVNRTLYYGDNLPALRRMNSGSVHLIATDPPFKKQKGFFNDAGGYDDTWTWHKDILGLDRRGNAVADNHEEWIDLIQDDRPGAWKVIDAARGVCGDDMGAFLCWLGVRLMELHRILRNDGSCYLHIDHTAHAWTKALMDAIFGKANFINEIAWCYKSGGASPRRHFSRKHDTILLYAKNKKNYVFNPQQEKSYNRDLKPYRFKGVREYQDETGWYTLVGMKDYWEISMVGRTSAERIGYPTQKPLELYERIIQASSHPGDIVLDPFCGCATTPVAAERLGRRWVGMDIWAGAYDTVLDRMRRELIAVPDSAAGSGEIGAMQFPDWTLTFINNKAKGEEFPQRTDDQTVAAPSLSLPVQPANEPWQKLSNKQIRGILAAAQSVDGLIGCAGCGRKLEPEFMHLDHLQPKSLRGENYITNRIPLCAPCNGRKGDEYTLQGLWKSNAPRKADWMKDAALTKRMFDQARTRATWVKDNWDTPECREFIANL